MCVGGGPSVRVWVGAQRLCVGPRGGPSMRQKQQAGRTPTQVFVANPNKPQPITDILTKNRDKLLKFLEEFHTEKSGCGVVSGDAQRSSSCAAPAVQLRCDGVAWRAKEGEASARDPELACLKGCCGLRPPCR